MVSKGAITAALAKGELRVLVCNDAASEGLNLQAASAVINYDLPWNPSRVEQRIGRIDRIGQKRTDVRIVNFFLEDSVDIKVYTVLRERCGVFEHFVGQMQPVLARARKMLLGRESVNLAALEAEAKALASDTVTHETYLDSEAEAGGPVTPSLTLADIEAALAELDGKVGPKAKKSKDGATWLLSLPAGGKRAVLSARLTELERDAAIVPLTPFAPPVVALADWLGSSGECLPLVVGAYQSGAFRTAVAYWVAGGESPPVDSFQQLRRLIRQWDGNRPSGSEYVAALSQAQAAARALVDERERQARQREKTALERQVEAARLRLQLELGRYLAVVGDGADLNSTLSRGIASDRAMSPRLQRAARLLAGKPNGLPVWPPALVQELRAYADGLRPSQKRARGAGSELDAALNDPRWSAAQQATLSTAAAQPAKAT
jgi:hypothetical protein